MARVILITVIFILASANSFSQKIEDIITDRPDQTESPSIVPTDFFQVEAGYTVESKKHSVILLTEPPIISNVVIRRHSIPSVLLRYGLFNNMELRLGIEIIRTTHNGEPSRKGIGPFVFGTKIKILDELEAAPETSFLFHLIVPQSSEGSFQPRYVGANFRFAMNHTFSRRFSFSYNFGAEWNGDETKPTGLYTVSLGILLVKKLSFFIEPYGFFTSGESFDQRLDGGFTYLFAKNIQADISAGFGITDVSPDYFLGAGFSIRLPR